MRSECQLIEPHEGDKRYFRRDEQGQFTEEHVDVGRWLNADNKQHSKTVTPKGQGDRGDHKK